MLNSYGTSGRQYKGRKYECPTYCIRRIYKSLVAFTIPLQSVAFAVVLLYQTLSADGSKFLLLYSECLGKCALLTVRHSK